MKLGLNIGYASRKLSLPLDLIAEVERLGFDSVWTSEAWGSDAVTTSAWILARTQRIRVGTAILQMPARTPTMTAMTAISLDQLSGGRFIVGLGPSGPQVVEGWYGASYAKPLTRLREYIEIMHKVVAREAPLTYDGYHYQLPYKGADSTGLGKPLKLIIHPLRSNIPIYLAAVGPKNVALAAEIADGWLPIFLSPHRVNVYREWLDEGFAKHSADRARKLIADAAASGESYIVWSASLLLIVGVVPGAVVGSFVAAKLRETAVRTVLSILLFAVAARMVYSVFAAGSAGECLLPYMDNWLRDGGIVVACGLAAGFLSAILGIGGGSLTVPPLVLIYGFTMYTAVPTALLAVVPTALTGALMQHKTTSVSRNVLIIVLPIAAVSAVAGALAQNHVPCGVLRMLFGVMLFIASVKLFSSRNKKTGKNGDSPPDS